MSSARAEFAGFGPAAVDFYAGLELDNSKSYWEAHRDIFEGQIKAPMAALIEQLRPATGPFRVFRPNRDVRFSADKSPYKTAHAALHSTGVGPDLYLHFSTTGLLVAAGIYVFEHDQLSRWRQAVDDRGTGASLVRAITSAERGGLVVDHGIGSPLATAPRGYRRDHPRITWLRWKGCITTTELDPAEAQTPDAVPSILGSWHTAAPVLRWLAKHIGPSTTRDD